MPSRAAAHAKRLLREAGPTAAIIHAAAGIAIGYLIPAMLFGWP